MDQWFSSDTQLHHVYPRSIQVLAERHWTPLAVARKVAEFLAWERGAKVLDIGSGVGKFCLAAGHYQPHASFFGVEQRQELVSHAEIARNILGLRNVHFLHDNLTELDFKQYDHFYFYNSFYENLLDTAKIDDKVPCKPELYHFYNQRLFDKLAEMRVGTKLATFHSLEDHIPPDYQLVETLENDLLKFWIKR